MNSLGNRFLKNNVRIMVINNGKGTEFRNYSHMASQFGEKADEYIAAAGHYGNKSKKLIKNYCESLGFKYISATSKQEFIKQIDYFLSTENYNYPIVFEVFTNSEMESEALKIIRNLKTTLKGKVKEKIGKTLSTDTKEKIKKLIGR